MTRLPMPAMHRCGQGSKPDSNEAAAWRKSRSGRYRRPPLRWPERAALYCALPLLSVACLLSPATAATFAVDTTADTTDQTAGDGLCRDNSGRCSLRAAIQEANALPGADEITLGAGTFALTLAGAQEDAAASGDLDVRSEIRIHGSGENACVIDGDARDRLFDVAAGGHLTAQRLRLQHGHQALFSHADTAEISGGALLVRDGGAAVLQRVDVRSNSSVRYGQGLAVFGSLQGERLRVEDNRGPDDFSIGGGLYIAPSASLVQLQDCEISGNAALHGGAIFSDGSATAITLQRCLLSGNRAGMGGAIHANLGASQWLLRNVTLSGNQADAGGAIFGDGQNELRLEHSTISANHAAGANGGGAILDVRGRAFGDFIPIELINSIVLGNTQAAGRECNTVFDDVIVSGGGTLHAPGDACILRAGAGDIVATEAGLAPLAGNGGFARSHALLAGSGAIDAALSVHCPATDQRGQPRPQDGDGNGKARCDIGAYERGDALFADGFDAVEA
ncbi:choice-of-anchor Q domain-containing protein [Tahibacter harae]|uniref:Right-handed parallel beta-helix repeat-containing protein n=1 Tax=Tahibacter harae TaxID=2963937 RepID=A0ABT1QV91_9GAMM|nr:choice-of-anchor Q domain-containing protein [Tahibacter harae]MCQ4166208.1 right-handed parallel beta-helix repeat-containing protein [Tahibacter harae]